MNITTDEEILKDLDIAKGSDVFKSEIYINPFKDYILFVAYEPPADCEDGTYYNQEMNRFDETLAIVKVTKVLGEVKINCGTRMFPSIEAAKNALLTIELSDMAGCLNKLI